MDSLEYSINDNSEKKEESNFKFSLKHKLCFGIPFVLIILLIIFIIIINIINYNKTYKDNNYLLNKLDKIQINISTIENVQINKTEKLKLEIEKNSEDNTKLKINIEKINEDLKNNINNETKNIFNKIEEINKEKNNLILELNKSQDELKTNYSNITEKIKQLEIRIEKEKEDILSSINNLKNSYENLNSRLDSIESEKYNKNKYYYNLFKGSTILTNDDKKIISKFIKPYYNLKFELIYKATSNDISNSNFHSKCDYKGPTVFIAKLKNNRRIGGFTSASWHQENKEIFDDGCFLFNLDLRIKFGLKKKGVGALYGQGGSSILFGPNYNQGDDFIIKNNIAYCNHGNAIRFHFSIDELCGGNSVFVQDFEVYSVKNYVS